jgi:hypothetical protein
MHEVWNQSTFSLLHEIEAITTWLIPSHPPPAFGPLSRAEESEAARKLRTRWCGRASVPASRSGCANDAPKTFIRASSIDYAPCDTKRWTGGFLQRSAAPPRRWLRQRPQLRRGAKTEGSTAYP